MAAAGFGLTVVSKGAATTTPSAFLRLHVDDDDEKHDCNCVDLVLSWTWIGATFDLILQALEVPAFLSCTCRGFADKFMAEMRWMEKRGASTSSSLASFLSFLTDAFLCYPNQRGSWLPAAMPDWGFWGGKDLRWERLILNGVRSNKEHRGSHKVRSILK